jgi:hypothetical protein
MNLLLLLVGFRAWSGSPIEVLTRVFCAVSLFALEMQFVTWTGLATLSTVVPVNAGIAAGLFVWLARVDRRRAADTGAAVAVSRVWLPFAAIGALVLLLNSTLPLEAADPYHLERVDRIHQFGTLAYDREADPKLNILGWLYELALADLRALPGVGPAAVNFHGAIGLVLYGVTSAAVLQILGVSFPLAGWLLAVVPVVFHQLVMVKNDLFGAIPAVLVLAWIVAHDRDALPHEGAWAGWLMGLAIGIKLTSFPLALVFAGALLLEQRNRARLLAASLVGAVTGLVAAGVLFLLVENVEVYGASVAPYGSLGNRTAGIVDAAVSVGRFAVSLVDMGLVTGSLWPGRGGWGGTYGLPVIWALGVLACAHRTRVAQRTLLVCGAYWAALAAVYPDADVAHRLALAPGLLAVAAAAAVADRDPRVPRWLRRLGMPVIVLSALQIVRSTVLYLART